MINWQDNRPTPKVPPPVAIAVLHPNCRAGPALPKHPPIASKAAYDAPGRLSIIASDIPSPVAERAMHNNKNTRQRFLPAVIVGVSSLGLMPWASAEIMLYDKDQTTFSHRRLHQRLLRQQRRGPRG